MVTRRRRRRAKLGLKDAQRAQTMLKLERQGRRLASITYDLVDTAESASEVFDLALGEIAERVNRKKGGA